jgi:bifunctional DNA-binding transcriptional regulator/antitoxin component of YhaV-PrlF toxin-antitoxin module
MRATAIVSNAGKITVPADVCAALGLKPGDKILFKPVPGDTSLFTMSKFRSLLDIARENPIEIPIPGGELDELINQSITDAMIEREQRIRQG